MKVVDKDLLAMKVAELKEELEARGDRVGQATRRGCAGACMRRLCASTSDPSLLPHALHSSAQTALLPF